MVSTVRFGNSDLNVVRIAHGTMGFKLIRIVPDEICFEALRTSLDLAPPGGKVIINTSEFYGRDPPTAGLEVIARFFEKYPEYADRCFLAVKGAMDHDTHLPQTTPEGLRTSITICQKILGVHKKIDHYEPARFDGSTSIEDIMKSLVTLKDEGLFEFIGLSEVSASTLRKACKVGPVSSVEIEVSPWTYTKEVQDVIATAAELDVTVLAYGALGKGFLTGADVLGTAPGLAIFPRFAEEARKENQKIVDTISMLAKKKGITNAQLCLAWVASLGPHVIPLPGSSNAARTAENFAAADIFFTPEEKAEIDAAVSSFQVVGERYPERMAAFLMQ
ncbi:aldo/keto reductase [Clavulina sp. PMI_390]|nr:aldo/keto reductase [Clavulina sp. PMI_390]